MPWLAALLAPGRRGPLLIGLGLVVMLVSLGGIVLNARALAARAALAEQRRAVAEQAAQETARALDLMRRDHERQMAAVAEQAAAERRLAVRLAEELEELRRDPSYEADADGVLRRAVERVRRLRDAAGDDPGGADPGAGAPAALRPGATAAGDAAGQPGPGGGAARAP